MDAMSIRLLAHILTIGFLLAVVETIIVVRRQIGAERRLSLNWRYWWLLCFALLAYVAWIILLALSIRDAALIKRGEIVWLLAGTELVAAISGLVWWLATVLVSFRLQRARPRLTDNAFLSIG